MTDSLRTGAPAPPRPLRAESLRLAVAQFAPRLRDVVANERVVAEFAASAAADLLVTPELSLTGYDLGDAVHRLARRVDAGDAFAGLEGVPEHVEVLVGVPERGARGPFNAAVLVQRGAAAFTHRKIYLPTYGMFDEGRWFGRGATLNVCTLASGWRAGILICEDFWHPGLVYVLASRGIDVLLVQAAAPGRGVHAGGEHGAFASADVWERMVRTTAQQYAIYVALANRTGVEGGVTFAGGSLIAGPDGAVLARAPDHGDSVISAVLTQTGLDAARTPYHHGRDDDWRLVAAELARTAEFST